MVTTIKNSNLERSGTFIDNMRLPIHRWFRFSAGFSAVWAEKYLESNKTGNTHLVLDPFAGSGTTLLASDKVRIPSIGIEAQPFIARTAKAKLLYSTSIDSFHEKAQSVLEYALKKNVVFENNYPEIINKCFSQESLVLLDCLRQSWLTNNDNTPASELTWLAITSILRSVSFAGTAQWQYILPNKKKKITLNALKAFQVQVQMMLQDMRQMQMEYYATLAKIIHGDSRNCPEIQSNSIDLVITSPPYANNYDYADATRFEMSFWGEIKTWGDLQNKVRKDLIVSSSQHSSLNKTPLSILLQNEQLSPIVTELTRICTLLETERQNHGGKKHYHTMIASYFTDMAKMWYELRRVCKRGSKLCFVIGDSAPYGIYVPVDKLLGQLAVYAGFSEWSFEKLRDRNIKWKNRKHRVPLNEGFLLIKG